MISFEEFLKGKLIRVKNETIQLKRDPHTGIRFIQYDGLVKRSITCYEDAEAKREFENVHQERTDGSV